MTSHYIAQLNVALMREPLESPSMKDCVDNLDRINQLAENAEGFIWRLESDEGNATSMRPFGEEYLVNMSVWRDVNALYDFVFGSAHVEIMRRRKEWFERMGDAYTVLWWIPAGHIPTVEEARERLDHLRDRGPTETAFTFKARYAPPRPSETAG